MTDKERITQLEARVAELEHALQVERSWEPKIEKHYADMAEWNNQCHLQEMGFIAEKFFGGKLSYQRHEAVSWLVASKRVQRLNLGALIEYRISDEPVFGPKNNCFTFHDERDRFPFGPFDDKLNL